MQTKENSRFNTRGTQRNVRLNSTPETPLNDPVSHFVDRVNKLRSCVGGVGDDDIDGITTHNEVNQSDSPIGFSLRRRISYRQIENGACLTRCPSPALDSTRRTLIVTVHSVTMPV